MAETRAKTCIHLIGEPQKHFGGRVLPTGIDVLKVYFFYHKKEGYQEKDAVKSVVQQICDIWAKARIPVAEQRNIVRKFEALLDKYRNICRNKNRGGQAQQSKEDDFVYSISLLFDIAHQDAMNLIKIEEDEVFLTDQRSERKYVMGGVDTDLA